MTLDSGAAVVGVEAEAAPVVVGVVGVGRELNERLRIRAGGRGPYDEEAGRLDVAPAPLHVLAAAILGLERHLVVAALPILRHWHGEQGGPAAAVRGGILGDRGFASGDVGLGEDDFTLGSEPGDLDGELWRGRGHVQRQLLARLTADPSGVALDEEGVGIGGVGDEGAPGGRQQ